MPGFWKGVSPVKLKSLCFLIYVCGIRKWPDTFPMKHSKSNQQLYFLSSFLLLSHPFSSISAFVSLFSLLTSSFLKTFLLSFSLFMILLCLLILFYTPALHLPSIFHTLCVAHLRGACNMWFNNRMPPLFHGLTSMIPFYTFHDLHFEFLSRCSVCFFIFLTPWHFFLSLLILCKLHLTWFGAFISCLVKLLAHACTVSLCVRRESLRPLQWHLGLQLRIRLSSGIVGFHRGYKCREKAGVTSHTTQEQMHIFTGKGQETFAKPHGHFPLPTQD